MIGNTPKLTRLKTRIFSGYSKVLLKETYDRKSHKEGDLSDTDNSRITGGEEPSFLLTSEKPVIQTDDSISLKNAWHTSNVSIKLISGFLIICVLTTMVGYLGLIATHQVEYLSNIVSEVTIESVLQEGSLLGIIQSTSDIKLGIIIGVCLTIISSIGIGIWMLGSIKKTLHLEKKSLLTEFRIKNERLLAMSELAARLGHDLRNPLVVIKGTLDIMKLYSKNFDEVTVKRITRLCTAVSNMARLVDHMLNFVKTSDLKIANNSICQIIKSAILKVDNTKNIQINYPNIDLKISCDYRLLEIVFVNLISNAINAIKGKGKINIKIIEREAEILVEFIDSGPGIYNRDAASKLFEPLFTTKIYGTGFGLACCISIIEQHKGKIFVKNNPTTFTVVLPKEQVNSNGGGE